MESLVTLVLGTSNAGKAAEFRGLLREGGWRLLDLTAFAGLRPFWEDGSTFAENARAKARQLAVQAKQWVLADDTGLEVDALDGAPGIHSARFAGPEASAQANRQRLLAELSSEPLERRGARFVCHLALADSGGLVRAEASGSCRGRIRFQPAGDGGFGYDCLFEIVEYHRTLAELGGAATSCLSHRARAVRALWPTLVRLLS